MESPIQTEEALFDAARRLSEPAARQRYMDEACPDPPVRARVEALLRVHDSEQSFLRPPAAGAPTIDRPAASERPGSMIGRYQLLERLGEGGMGDVWMAEQTQPVRRRVAVKVIRPGMDTAQVVARFEAERQALAIMDHPNIARVFDGGTTDRGRPYFVMELVTGTPITKYCDEKRLPIRDRLGLFADVCRAVQHAHQKGVIHRDLKPSNVLVAPCDTIPVVKVIDFGVAKAIEQRLTDKTLVTGFGAVVGTPEYMSPEQAELNNADIDTRTDIYSLGVLLYELLTGTTPLTDRRAREAALLEVLRLVREEEPPRPSTRLSSTEELPSIAARRGLEPQKLSGLVRGELDWIVMRALEKDRARRYESANALAADVGRYLADEPVQARPPSAPYRLRKFARRNKAELAFAGLVLLFLVSLGGGIGWVAGDRAARRSEASKRVDDALTQARAFMKDENWPGANAAVQRAKGLLAGAGGGDSLHRRLGQVEADLDMAAELESARLHKATVKDGRFADASADPLYEAAFREYGIPVGELDPDEAARRVADSALREQLLAALVDWAYLQVDPARFRKLTALVRLADDDPWRKQLFDASARHDWAGVARLAQGPDALRLPPARVVIVAHTLAGVDLPAAIGILQRAQQRHPDDFWINHQLAAYLHGSKPPRLDAAIGYYRAAVALRRESPGAHLNLGIALQDLGDVSAAEGEYREAVRLKSDYVQAFNQLGAFLCDVKRDYAGASAAFREALRLKPDDALVHVNLGNALIGRGRAGEAQAEYQEAIRLDPGSGKAHGGLGLLLEAQGKPDEAIREYREAIRLNPTYEWAHSNLGAALGKKGRTDEAIAAIREAIRLNKDFAPAHGNLGAALAAKGLLDEAIAEYKEAVRLKSDVAEAHYILGNALLDKRLLDEAIAEYKETVRLKPDLAEAHGSLGNALLAKGELDEAIVEYKQAIRLKPDLAEAHNNLGNALLDKRLPDEAIAEYQETIRLKPNNSMLHGNLGNALLARGRTDEAIREYKEVLRLNPDHAIAHNNLGLALLDKARLEEAAVEFREAVRLRKDDANARRNLIECLQARGDHAGVADAAADYPRLLPDSWPEYRRTVDLLARCVALAEQDSKLSPDQRRAAVDAYAGRAGQVLREATKRLPEELGVRNALVRCLADHPEARFRDPESAVALAEKAVQSWPEQAVLWTTLGLAHYRAGHGKQAVAALSEATVLRKTGEGADLLCLALARGQLGNQEAARGLYARASTWMGEKRPGDPDLCRLQVEAAIALGLTQPWAGRHFARHRGSVNCVAFDGGGQRLATGGQDKVVRLWDLATGREVRVLEGHTREVWGVAFRLDGERIASAAGDRGQRDQPGEVIVWDVRTGKRVLTLAGPQGGVFCLAYSPDGRHLASAGFDGVIRIWDADSGKEERALRGHAGQVCGLAYRPDGERLVSAGYDRTVKLWDVAAGKEVSNFTGHGGVVWSVAFSPDGHRVASASDDFTVKVWQPGADTAITLEGHTTTPYSVAFSPDGKSLVSASGHRWQPEFPGEVKLWDAATGKPLRTLQRPTSGFFCAAFGPDGERVAAGGLDHTITLCDLPGGGRNTPDDAGISSKRPAK